MGGLEFDLFDDDKILKICSSKSTDGDNGDSVRELMRLNYFESQSMSHANGYLYFCNPGAWGGGFDVAIWLEEIIVSLIYKMYGFFECFNNFHKKHGTEIDGRNKMAENVLRNATKNMGKIADSKIKFYVEAPKKIF